MVRVGCEAHKNAKAKAKHVAIANDFLHYVLESFQRAPRVQPDELGTVLRIELYCTGSYSCSSSNRNPVWAV